VVIGVGVGHWSVLCGVLRSIRHLAAASQLDKMLSRNHERRYCGNKTSEIVSGDMGNDGRTVVTRATGLLEDMEVFLGNSW
jgi:hypothetical protein